MLDRLEFPIHSVETLVLGTGAAGLNAALQLRRKGHDDLILLTDSLTRGTSANTGSDKQTYYKLGVYGNENDSPERMAQSLFQGGAMDGDIALIESALSLRAFYNLLDLGLDFPLDAFGQLPGYKTDHDPCRRATSMGPYTSQAMCKVLLDELRRRNTCFHENRLAVRLFCVPSDSSSTPSKRIAGVFCINLSDRSDQPLELYLCDRLVFAVGGPGGLYRDSVYPECHIGGIGLALEVGAEAVNLAESQFGLASTKFRWNVSGTYMQVIPRLFSTDPDGQSRPHEFLSDFVREWGSGQNETSFDLLFKKGYQWPFDAAKITGSSLVDLAVYHECVHKKRRVFLDYRRNPEQWDVTVLSDETREYLEKSGALFGIPYERLNKMNPIAVELYRSHGIDLQQDPLEIALCTQHNNGGLAVTPWWESVNIRNLFVAGEVAGTHGVTRPGGSALNSGQVAGFRIADYLSSSYYKTQRGGRMDPSDLEIQIQEEAKRLCRVFIPDWKTERTKLQARMSDHGAAMVRPEQLKQAIQEAKEQTERLYFHAEFCSNIPKSREDWAESLRTRQLSLAQFVYLESILAAVSRHGSRGARLCRTDSGDEFFPNSFLPEIPEQRERIQQTTASLETGQLEIEITDRLRKPIPENDAWFETAWANYRAGLIYQ